MIRHLIQFSGGVGSWAAAKRVVERHGLDGVVLLFADVKKEDCDLYRFIREAAENVGAPLVTIAEGRTPWQVFFDERMMGGGQSGGADPCSKILKRQLMDRWRGSHCNSDVTTSYVGIDWSERHRFFGNPNRPDKPGLRDRMAAYGWRFEAPLCDPPYLDKEQMLAWLRSEGIEPPRLYEMGFPHNNCGGFCIKAGIAQFVRLLQVMPERYAYHEQKEQEFRAFVGKDVAILRDRRKGQDKPLTLKALRERIERQPKLTFEESLDWGGCGCAID